MGTTIPVGTNWHKGFPEWLEPFPAVFRRSGQRCRAAALSGRAAGAGSTQEWSGQWPDGCVPGRRSNSTTWFPPRPGSPFLGAGAAQDG
jgi:hypothetical protein